MSVFEAYTRVTEELAQYCHKAGRDPSEVRLMAVSKRKPLSMITELASKGITLFGENRVQEVQDKYLGDTAPPPGIELHFIGHLQRNKVKALLPVLLKYQRPCIQSVDSLGLLEALDKQLHVHSAELDILIQVNTSGEEQKYGLRDPGELEALLGFCAESGRIKPRGLMTMAPFIDNASRITRCFSELRRIFEAWEGKIPGWEVLSMGMSGDMEHAIAEGSTMVRVGTAIFGQREF